MWYFSWILGLGLAVTFGILNAIWYEVRADTLSLDGEPDPTQPQAQGNG